MKVVEAACGVAITQKGIYGGGQPGTRTEKLHLVIEGDSERKVQEAKNNLMHIAQGPQAQAAKDHTIHYAQAPNPAAAAADGRTYDQMATTNAAQGQPPQTFPAGGNHGSGTNVIDPSRIFVNGLCFSVDDAGLGAYFETYGTVRDAHVKTDHLTKRSRGGG